MLALKLAELSNVEARLGDPPVLLLDDVPSELDPVRRGLLFDVIAGLACQTLISVTEREIVPTMAGRAEGLHASGRARQFESMISSFTQPLEDARLLETFGFVVGLRTAPLNDFFLLGV